MGSVTNVTSIDGSVIGEKEYTPFGLARETSVEVNTELGFIGRKQYEEIGLTYIRARFYDPVSGRFITKDPVRDGFNWYSYCGSNPVGFVDRNGKETLTVGTVAVLGIAIIGTYVIISNPDLQRAMYESWNDLYKHWGNFCTDNYITQEEASFLAQKMEMERILEKAKGPQGVQYSLRARVDGYYPNVRGGTTYLRAYDVWKYGETTSHNRYTYKYLENSNLIFIPEFAGTQMEIKIVEKLRIYGYFFSHGYLPPGNRIFR